MVKERENWLDVAKGIAIIFVVLGHIFTSYANSGYAGAQIPVLKWLYNTAYGFHMPLFFCNSRSACYKIFKIRSLWKTNNKKSCGIWNTLCGVFNI